MGNEYSDKDYKTLKRASIIVPIILFLIALLHFPLSILLRVPVLIIGFLLDGMVMEAPEVGHAFPVLTVIVLFLFYAFMTFSAIVFAISSIVTLVILQLLRIAYKRRTDIKAFIKTTSEKLKELNTKIKFVYLIPLFLCLFSLICDLIFFVLALIPSSLPSYIGVVIFVLSMLFSIIGLVISLIFFKKRKDDIDKINRNLLLSGVIINSIIMLIRIHLLAMGIISIIIL